jgi:hypothetical protein
MYSTHALNILNDKIGIMMQRTTETVSAWLEGISRGIEYGDSRVINLDFSKARAFLNR